ncbi:MAG: hypothetical protein LDL37_01695, partial [Asticcacaulis sp.]|uniref:tyrosine-type recombinase/integrase n=1 Tax=Asticcacaulis sp. TaxID=1872648 RepID=UPI0025BEFDD6
WAGLLREAHAQTADGEAARTKLRIILEKLQPPADDEARWRRAMVQDIITAASDYLALRPTHDPARVPRSNRTVSSMLDGYFANPPKATSGSTLKQYLKVRHHIDRRFGPEDVKSLTRGQIRLWYEDLIETRSLSMANLITAALGAAYSWAMLNDWVSDSPCTKLKKAQPEGRIMIWPFAIESAFVTWCDENGFEDVADAVVTGCYTGASQIDMCTLRLGDFNSDIWRFRRVKTKQEAVVAWLPQVRARAERRRQALASDGINYITPDVAPFLFRRGELTRGPHHSKTIGERYREARTAVMAQVRIGDLPELVTLHELNLSDTRDTCVTRLFLAGIPLDRIPLWTGHSQRDAERILRRHYLMLTEEGAQETAALYERYAAVQNLALK